jgi:isopentenyldiphosphate isomerase
MELLEAEFGVAETAEGDWGHPVPHFISGIHVLNISAKAFEYFGFNRRGVHLIAFKMVAGEAIFWVATRSQCKMPFPLKKDDTAASNIRLGETKWGAVRRAAFEEAGIDEDLAKNIKYIGTASYAMATSGYDHPGHHEHTQEMFLVQLPPEFVPRNNKEVLQFEPLSGTNVIKSICNGEFAKWRLMGYIAVMIFLGYITSGITSDDREFNEIFRRIHRPLVMEAWPFLQEMSGSLDS